MTERNVSPRTKPPVAPPGLPQAGIPQAGIPLGTPLVWAWGGVLLTATTWLGGVIALFRSVGGLFD